MSAYLYCQYRTCPVFRFLTLVTPWAPLVVAGLLLEQMILEEQLKEANANLALYQSCVVQDIKDIKSMIAAGQQYNTQTDVMGYNRVARTNYWQKAGPVTVEKMEFIRHVPPRAGLRVYD